MDEKWTKIESDVWNPEEGDELSGKYLGVEHKVGINESNLYTIETDEGKQLGVWGSKVLDGKMLSLVVGQPVKIKFVGKVKPEKGNEYKDFEVFKGSTIPAPTNPDMPQ